jgi:hypothetical protein
VRGAIRIDARHVARSVFVAGGLTGALVVAAARMRPLWPLLAGDDQVAYEANIVLSSALLLAGALLGLRDRLTGAADLVATTPTPASMRVMARLASVAPVAAGAFAALFAACLGVSLARGGHGHPDLRLLADGMLVAVLGAWVGFIVGLSGSRLRSLVAAPLWAVALYLPSTPSLQRGASASLQWLTPMPLLRSRSVALGFLPDVWWPHLAYLAGLVVLAGGLLVLAFRLLEPRRGDLTALMVALVAALLVTLAAAARLVALPDTYQVGGAARSSWQPVRITPQDVDDPRQPPRTLAYADDGLATTCAGDPLVRACVYPAYGQRLAERELGQVQAAARLLHGLAGVPSRLRMVPASGRRCSGSDVLLPERPLRDFYEARSFDEEVLTDFADCATNFADRDPATIPTVTSQLPDGGTETRRVDLAQEVVRYWVLLRTGKINPIYTTPDFIDYSEVRPAQAMARLPDDQVRRELGAKWELLRAGRLAVADLPGQGGGG